MREFNSKPLDLDYASYQKKMKNIVGLRIGDYDIKKQLGKGNYSAVYLGENDKGVKFAFKVIDLREISNEINYKIKEIRQRLAVSEPKLMMQCDSPHLLKCLDIFENRDLKVLKMEYCQGKTLDTYLQKRKKLPEREAVDILRQIISGISELHRHKIVHRDLKTENIMQHQGEYKIIDFGFSKQLLIKNEQDQIKNTLLGTPTTMAPQVFFRKNYGLKADIWSIGIIFFEMVFGIQPYDSSNAKKFYQEIEKRFDVSEPQRFNGVTLSQNAHDFLKKVLRVDSEQRIDWRSMLEHPLIRIEKEEALPERFILKHAGSLIVPDVDERLVNEDLISVDINLSEHIGIEVSVQKTKQEEKKNQEQKKKQEEKKKKEQEEKKMQERAQRRINLQKLLEEQEKRKMEKAQEDYLRQQKERKEKLRRKEEEIEQNISEQYHRCQEMHLSCLKTEFIYHNIVSVIERDNLINLSARESIEFMHLLLSRCFKNMSVLKDYLKKHPTNAHRALRNLDEQIRSLYDLVTRKFWELDALLTSKENQKVQIVKDFFSKIIWKSYNQKKNQMIGGIEKVHEKGFGDFSQKQQIEYTCQYIKRIIPKLAKKQASKPVEKILSNYSSIASVRLQELGDQSFREFVDMITS